MSSDITSKGMDKSRVTPSDRERKKQKKEGPTFSDPTTLATFLVGPGDQPAKFIVHKEVACDNSKIFDAAFNSAFVEGQNQTYRLDDATEKAFRMVVQWMYSRRIHVLQLQGDSTPDKDEVMAENASLAELWVLADKLGIPRLQNLAIDFIEGVSRRTKRYPTSTFRYIYENTATGSQLRRYTVTACVWGLSGKAYTSDPERFPKQMLLELAELQTEMWKEADVSPRPVSDFYVSTKEE